MPYGNDENKFNILRSERTGVMSESSKLTLNYSQFLNSERFLLGTQTGLKSYISTKIETERPLSVEENLERDKIDSELKKMLKELKI